MKCNFAKFLFKILYVVYITCLSIKQNLVDVCRLRPHTLSLLIRLKICLSIKQNFGHAWLLGQHTLSKLILLNKYSSAKQNIGHAWFL